MLESEIKKIRNIPLKDRAKVRHYLNKCKQADKDVCQFISELMKVFRKAQLNEDLLSLASKLLSDEDLQKFKKAQEESKPIADYWHKVFKYSVFQVLLPDEEAFKFLQRIEFTLYKEEKSLKLIFQLFFIDFNYILYSKKKMNINILNYQDILIY